MADPGPLQGIYQEFFLPIIKDPTKSNPDRGTEEGAEKYERAYMKEPVGFFLSLPVAKNRTGEFGGQGLNKDRKFNYRKQRASKKFTLILRPSTEITIFNPLANNGAGQEITTKKNSISFSVPRTIAVSEIMAWLCNPTVVLPPLRSAIGGTGVTGEVLAKNYESIIGIITPDDRRHNIRTLLTTGSSGQITSDVTLATTRDTISTSSDDT